MEVENKVKVELDQKVETDTSANSNVSVETKPVKVETSFESTVEVSFPEFRAGSSGFTIEIFGIPVLGVKPFHIGTERASEVFGGLFFGEEFSAIPSYRITDKCIGCTTCARQCPTGAIYGAAKKRFNINPSQCILCGTCGRSCPVSAIVDQDGNTVKRVKPKEKKVPVIDEDQCSGCENCVNICPFNCLAIKEDGAAETIKGVSFLEKKAKCVSCGECERICPQDAIVLKEPEHTEPAKKAA